MVAVAETDLPSVESVESTSSEPSMSQAVSRLLAAFAFLSGARLIADNSFFTHLATGRLILDDRAVPTSDPYSGIAAGQPWTVQSWLASLIYALVEATAGVWSIRVLNGLLCVGVVAVLWRFSSEIKSVMLRAAILAPLIAGGSVMWSPRPLLFGLLGLALVLEVALGRRATWQLLPIMWIWVNTHGSFPLAGVAVGTILVGRWLDTRVFPRADAKTLGWVTAGTLLGGINPLGLKILTFPIELLGRREALEGVTEWERPALLTFQFAAFALLLAGALFVGVRRRSWTLLVPTIAFGASGLMAVRNLSSAAVVIVAMLGVTLSGATLPINYRPSALIVKATNVMAVCISLLTVLSIAATGGLGLDPYPVAQVDWLEERGLVASQGGQLGHADDVGNYLELRFGADANVFMDDRYDYYPLDLVQDHRALVVESDRLDILDARGIDVVLWETETELAESLLASPEWEIAQSDDDWLIACRVSSASHASC